MKGKNVNVLLFTLLFYTSVIAVTIHPNAGKTSAVFLKLPVGARASAIQAFSAISDDPSAIYFNPAGLTQLHSLQLLFMHNEHFQNIKHNFFTFVTPFKYGNVGAAFIGLFLPEMEKRTWAVEPTLYADVTEPEGYFTAHSFAFMLSFARKIKNRISTGINIKYISESIYTYSAWTVAIDMGMMYRFNSIRVALTGKNIGFPIKFLERSTPLTSSINLSASNNFFANLNTAIELQLQNDNFPFVVLGLEYKPIYFLSFRGGYRYRFNGNELGGLHGLALGMGISFYGLFFDYSFTPYEKLGASHKLSFTLDINEFAKSIKVARYRPKIPAPPEEIKPEEKVAEIIEPKIIEEVDARPLKYEVSQDFQKISRVKGINYFTAKSETEDLYEISFRIPHVRPLSVGVNVKMPLIQELLVNATQKVYKSYSIEIEPYYKLRTIECKLKIPKSIFLAENLSEEKIYIIYPVDGTSFHAISAEKYLEDDKFNYYTFKVGSNTFSVILTEK